MNELRRFVADRPWFQFILWAVALLSPAIFVPFWFQQRAQEQEHALEELTQLRAQFNFESPSYLYFDTSHETTNVFDDIWQPGKRVSTVNDAVLERALYVLRRVNRLNDLEALSLEGTQVTDAGLEYLKGLTKLRSLNLEGTRVTAEGARDLQEALPKCRISFGRVR